MPARRRMRLPCLALLAALAACTSGEWETKGISGMLPALAFSLTDERGEPVSAEDYRGTAILLFFGFTSCRNACPTTLSRLSGLLDRLPEAERRRIRVLFVSVDPGRDDPRRLRAYTRNFGPRFVGLTGTQDQLRALTRRCRVTYGYGEPDADGAYSVSHSAVVLGYGPGGEARVLIRNDDPAQAILADLRRLVRADTL